MASIAYISDPNLLEYHRLNQDHEMNFWRLSLNMNFSDFKDGDLLFFLSKDKEYQRHKEKGIMGYGRCTNFHSSSITTMWKRYGSKNGYATLKNFKEAIMKVTKDHSLPKKISSIYLEDVVFFSSPIYLSECGKKISKATESYIYIESATTIKILEKAKDVLDVWSGSEDIATLEKEAIRHSLFTIHDKIAIEYPNSTKAKKEIARLMSDDPGYKHIRKDKTTAYKIDKNDLYIAIPSYDIKDRMMEKRVILGQEALYRMMFDELYPYNLNIIFVILKEGRYERDY